MDASDVRSARAARKEATAAIGRHTGSLDTLAAAELIIGELLSNAARHGGNYVCLQLRVGGGHAQISVHDTSERFALDFKAPEDQYSEDGRGLFIVSELARRIDVQPVEGFGKRVDVTLDLALPDDAFTPACDRPWLAHEAGVCMAPRVARYYPSRSPFPVV